jgi:hypothetical protein
MAIKLLILKSYEDIIADVREMMSGDKVVGYLLKSPYVTRLNEEEVGGATSVTYYPYVPLTKQKEIPIPCDWVVSIVEPLDEVKESYLEHVNDKDDSSDEQSDSDQSD